MNTEMPSGAAEDDRFRQLRTLTQRSGAEAVFLLDANVLMGLPGAWTAPARGARAPIFAIAQCTYEEILRIAREPRKKNQPEHVERRGRLANSVLRWLDPSLESHELHRGAIRDDGKWIMLSSSQLVLDPWTVKYFGEGDAGLLRMAEELQSQNWMPPVSIISGDRRDVRPLALGRQLKSLDPSEAQNSSAVREWLDLISPAPLPAITVRSILETAPKLCLAEIDIDIFEVPSLSEVPAKIASETVTVGIMVFSVESEKASSTKATGAGIFLGQECGGSFRWEATTEISDDGGIETKRVIDFKQADTIPAYVVQGVRDAVELILARRLYPPDHVAHAWFHAIFVENGIGPAEAWLDVGEPFDFELGTFGSVVEALEDCERRWPNIDWPAASDFVQDVMHHVCPGQLIGLKLAPESVDS